MNFTSEASLILGSREDFPNIYEDMKKQFPTCEMYDFKIFMQLLSDSRYKLLLYKHNADQAIIGYALVYTVESSNILWLDYLAVVHGLGSHGYGSALFNELWKTYCGPYKGMMFSVEHVSKTDEALALRQKRRLNFYERLGAYRLKAEFLLPCDNGSVPMYLYYKPRDNVNSVSREEQLQSILDMYDTCFFYLKHRTELLPQFRHTIADEHFG